MQGKRRFRAPACARLAALWLALVLFAAGFLAATAQGAPFRRLAGGVVSFASDGVRYVAWQRLVDSAVVVFDTRTGRRHAFSVPAGCELANEEQREFGRVAAAGRFLVDCKRMQTERTLILDGRSGSLSELPALNPGNGWVALGTRYVLGLSYPTDEGKPEPSSCPQSRIELARRFPCFAIMGLSQRTVTYRPESLWPDLDVSGAPEICPTLRSKLNKETRAASSNPRFLDYSDGYYAQPTANYKTVELDRCSGARVLLRAGGEPENFDVRGGILSWDTGLPGFLSGEGPRKRVLSAYRYQTHRLQTWTLPVVPVREDNGGEVSIVEYPLGYSTHTAGMVFWIAMERRRETGGEAGNAEVLSSIVFAARMQ
jgi:hypothetical protein